MAETLGRVLLLNANNIGDMVLMTPLVDAILKSAAPSRLGVVAKRHCIELFEVDARFDDLFPLDFRWTQAPGQRRATLSQVLSVLHGIRKQLYDVAIVTQSDVRTNLLAWCCGVKRVYGVEGRHGEWLLSKAVHPPDDAVHEVERLLAVVTCWGEDSRRFRSRDTSIVLTQEHIEWACSRLRPIMGNQALVAMHLGSNAQKKNWPVANFENLALRLRREVGAALVLLGGSQPELDAAFRVQKALCRDVVNLSGSASLLQMAAVLKQADLFVGNDSGPAHLASAVGTRVVTIFGQANWRRFGPWRHDKGYRVCHPREDGASAVRVSDVTVEEVFVACVDLLNVKGWGQA